MTEDPRRGAQHSAGHGTPWATEADVRARLASVWTERLDRVLAVARRVHGRQTRDDGTPYLEEHVFPVAIDVADYLARTQPADVELGAAVALAHDVLEDRPGTDPPLDETEARSLLGPEVAPWAEILAKSTLSPGLSAEEKQAAYLRRLQAGPRLARVIKVFDRLNNLACVHKNPPKAPGYREESRRDYLPLAEALDPELGRRMEGVLGGAPADEQPWLPGVQPSAPPLDKPPGGWLAHAFEVVQEQRRQRDQEARDAGARWLIEGSDLWDFQRGDEDAGVFFHRCATEAEVDALLNHYAADEWNKVVGIYDLAKPLEPQRGGIEPTLWLEGVREVE